MPLQDAELFIQAMDDQPAHREVLEDVLNGMPGIEFVSERAHDDPTVEKCVQIAHDPQITNPVIIKEELGRRGITVLSANEETSDQPSAVSGQ